MSCKSVCVRSFRLHFNLCGLGSGVNSLCSDVKEKFMGFFFVLLLVGFSLDVLKECVIMFECLFGLNGNFREK